MEWLMEFLKIYNRVVAYLVLNSDGKAVEPKNINLGVVMAVSLIKGVKGKEEEIVAAAIDADNGLPINAYAHFNIPKAPLYRPPAEIPSIVLPTIGEGPARNWEYVEQAVIARIVEVIDSSDKTYKYAVTETAVYRFI